VESFLQETVPVIVKKFPKFYLTSSLPCPKQPATCACPQTDPIMPHFYSLKIYFNSILPSLSITFPY